MRGCARGCSKPRCRSGPRWAATGPASASSSISIARRARPTCRTSGCGVQARQIFVFSCAHTLGWPGALDAAADGRRFPHPARAARRSAHGCARSAATATCSIRRPISYDLAFVVFASLPGATQRLGRSRRRLATQAHAHARRGSRRHMRPESGEGFWHQAVPVRAGRGCRTRTCICWKRRSSLFVASARCRALCDQADALVELFRTALLRSGRVARRSSSRTTGSVSAGRPGRMSSRAIDLRTGLAAGRVPAACSGKTVEPERSRAPCLRQSVGP